MKSWYRSKTIWGAMIMLVSLILTSITGVQISEDEQGQAGDLVMNGVEAGLALFGFILTIIGRVKAKHGIGGGGARAAKSIIVVFMASALLVGCTSIKESGIKEKWEALTPNEKARIILNDFQEQLNDFFDQSKAFVESNPQHLPLWKEKIVPAFDVANKAIKVSLETGKDKTLTPDIIYRDIGPLVESVVKLLIQIGAIKPIQAAIPLAAIAMILAAINALIGTAFRLYSSLRQIQGDEKIPEWEEITDKNRLLQAKIDAEKEGK